MFNYVAEAVQKRVSNWKAKMLSMKEKEVLIKAVINALPVYVMSYFKLPITICREITAATANFWWGSKEKRKQKIH